LKKSFKVAVTDYNFPNLDIEKSVLEEAGAELFPKICKNENELIEHIKDADGIIDQFFPITRRAIEHLQKCKVIAVYGIGTNQIDIKAASEKQILIVNVPDYCIDEVATHAVALLLGCAREVSNYDRLVKNGNWAYMALKLHRFCGKTVGIVGMGAIGKSVAKKLSGFELKLIGYDPYVDDKTMSSCGVEKVEIEDIFRNSDFITLHLPLTENTKNLISADILGLMKPTAYLINVSRGGLVDEAALINLLNMSKIAGVALDVLAKEPPDSNSQLITHSKSVITPHIAWYSDESYIELRVKVAQSVADVLNGRTPKSVVNKHMIKRC
jgi:D-3-phosphoglycerate dehydrogenase